MHASIDKGVNVAALTCGLRITTKLLTAWGQGCVELYQQVSDYADVVTEEEDVLCCILAKHDVSWPGVFAYEVSEEIGEQLRSTIKVGGTPDKREVLERCRVEITRFCMRGSATDGAAIAAEYRRLSELRRAAKS